ncbi:MAG: winged helix-turn-helix domain-containing protein [Bacilli bacterium]
MIKIDTSKKQVFIAEEVIDLTAKEYTILHFLRMNADKTLKAEEIIEHAWDSDFDLFSNTFKFHIHSLRKEIFRHNAKTEIRNIRRLGYRIVAEKQL